MQRILGHILFLCSQEEKNQKGRCSHNLFSAVVIAMLDNVLNAFQSESHLVVSDSDPMECSLADFSVHGVFRQEYWNE